MMKDLVVGAALIIIGLLMAGFGGTMSDWTKALFYIVGFLVAFIGLGLLLKYYRKTQATGT
jgi:type IV secretory pathway VirB2 component (pilin)